MKKLIPVFLVIILVGAGVFTLRSTGALNNKKPASTQPSLGTNNESEYQVSEFAPEPESRYQPYTSQAIAQARGKVVLFFYANWCPVCRPLDAELQANPDKIPEGLTIIRVNYQDSETDDEEKALAEKYAITYQHTFVQINQAGNQITKWNGGSLAEIIAKVK